MPVPGIFANGFGCRVSYPTPTAITASGGAAMCKWGGAGARRRLHRVLPSNEVNGALNPDWEEWLMGWPVGWSRLDALPDLNVLGWERDPADNTPPTGLLPTPTVGNATGGNKTRSGDRRNELLLPGYAVLHPGFGRIPRVAKGVKDRTARVKALGNGQVPLCVVLAVAVLAEAD